MKNVINTTLLCVGLLCALPLGAQVAEASKYNGNDAVTITVNANKNTYTILINGQKVAGGEATVSYDKTKKGWVAKVDNKIVAAVYEDFSAAWRDARGELHTK